jgi:hypothetical protein
MFPQIENKINYLINGIETDGYSYCSTARQFKNMCGKDGKMFKRKYKRVNETINTIETN